MATIQQLFPHHPVRAVIFRDGVFHLPEDKTAQGIMRHSIWLEGFAVINRSLVGGTTESVIPDASIPIVGDMGGGFTLSAHGQWLQHRFVAQPRQPGDLPHFDGRCYNKGSIALPQLFRAYMRH